MELKLKTNNKHCINNKENFVGSFFKHNYEYRIYILGDTITIEKEDIKSEKFYIKSYKIN